MEKTNAPPNSALGMIQSQFILFLISTIPPYDIQGEAPWEPVRSAKMNRHIAWSLPIALLALGGARSLADPSSRPLVRVLSPNGQVRIELVLERYQEVEAVPHYRVFFKDRPIVLPSRLAIDLAEGTALGGPCLIDSVETHSRRTEYEVFPGKRRHVLDQCTEC